MHISDPLAWGRHAVLCLTATWILAFAASTKAQQASSAPADLVIRNTIVMTASHGTIEHGSVWVHAGKIAGVGATVNAPS